MNSKKHAKAQVSSCGSKSLLSYAKITTKSTSSSATQSPGCVTSKIDQPGPSMPNTDLPLESRPNSKQPAPLKMSNNAVLRAEVIWTMRTISVHSSARSSDDVGNVFRDMFPDSKIAESFQCSRTKLGYLATFGIAPAIKSSILNSVKDSPYYVVMFDESHNEDLDKKHLDLHDHVAFMLSTSFRHGSEKSGWALGEFLRDLYTLFKKAPARKDDYFNAAGESTPKLPLKFCGHRWLENVPAAERALEIWPLVLLYNKAVRKREASKPSCKSYQTIMEKESDQLFTAKLHSFIFLANILRPFLEKFQKDAPLAPFLVPSLLAVVKRLYSLILTQEAVAGIKNAADLSLPKDLPSSSFKKESEISLGHQAELALDEVKTKVSALKIKDLKQSFSACIKEILTRMLQKSPLSEVYSCK
ncbi:peptidase m20 domain-containing protein 2 [Plakobranchus ocellatus]|uniref:Peptidase m20 domain-containing protein 2 n=1 Tax=Plakobranchus ocellatus TaxID=259542 RepID=A0AAV3ZKV1_9GAST|nr:peptidase m20 domain-containing protein 2 [Plakobranchus ocellatus]